MNIKNLSENTPELISKIESLLSGIRKDADGTYRNAEISTLKKIDTLSVSLSGRVDYHKHCTEKVQVGRLFDCPVCYTKYSAKRLPNNDNGHPRYKCSECNSYLESENEFGAYRNTIQIWNVVQKGKNVIIELNPSAIIQYLQNAGYCYVCNGGNVLNRTLVRIKNNIITAVDNAIIKHEFADKYIIRQKNIITGNYTKSNLRDEIIKSLPNILEKRLDFLPIKNIKRFRDDEHCSYLFYSNGVVSVYKDRIQLLDYNDLHSPIWDSQIIQRPFKLIEDYSIFSSQFSTFCEKVTTLKNDGTARTPDDQKRFQSLTSTIGYLCRNFKTPSLTKAVLFTENNIATNIASGGTGKGLILQGVSKVRNLSYKDGKTFEFTNFCWQGITPFIDIIFIDDVEKNFDYSKLYTAISEGIVVEQKYQKPIKYDIAESPTLAITDNRSLTDTSNSTKRRFHEMELSSYYPLPNGDTPREDIGDMFSADWDENEWALFDNFIAYCIQVYLRNGLIVYESSTKFEKKLRDSIGVELVEFLDDKIKSSFQIATKTIYEDFLEYANMHTGSRKPSTVKFGQSVKFYCDLRNIIFESKPIKIDGKPVRHLVFTLLSDGNKW